MAAKNYDEALKRLLVHEGGYTNHPSDPGGATNWGITIADYRRYVNPNATAADVKTMPLSSAKKIYREKYWNAVRGDDLPSGVDYAVFDFGVNSGVSRSAKYLQRILGVPQTGIITDIDVNACQRHNAANLAIRLCDDRLAFLKALKTWPVFGKGWGRRVAEVRAASIAMANGSPPTVPPVTAPSPTQPAASGLFAVLINIVKAIFGAK